jgi:hypothetical protein
MARLTLAVGLLAVVGVLAFATMQGVGWAMQASGYNCMMRKIGYERGAGLDDPPATSKYCKGHTP